MTFREAVARTEGLRFMAERLDVRSALGRAVLFDSCRENDPAAIDAELTEVGRAVEAVSAEGNREALRSVLSELGQVKDIRASIGRLAGWNEECDAPLDDVELFEMKVFALAAVKIAQAGAGIPGAEELPDIMPVVGILDPDGNRVPHFYIYDSYDPQLAALRLRLKEEEGQAKAATYALCEEIELKVRMMLTGELAREAEALAETARRIARLDIVVAKARQAVQMGLCRPQVAAASVTESGADGSVRGDRQDVTGVYPFRIEGMWNPGEAARLEGEGVKFQPVDISVGNGPTLITGANMGGKTVVLKTLALVQALFQYGFYVPARTATLAPVDETALLAEADAAQRGLSSFASEVVRINALTEKVKAGWRVLALIDEPARSTNPEEGKAIVAALLDFLAAHRTPSVVTSHFSGIDVDVRRLRVRGFRGEEKNMEVADIQRHMDYSLTEDSGREAPREALRVARMLGMDGELLAGAEKHLKD